MDTTTYSSPSTYSTQDSGTDPSHLLSRPRHGRMIGGVCAGIARRFGWNVTWVRVAAVAACFLPGPMFLVYVIAWLLMPEDRA